MTQIATGARLDKAVLVTGGAKRVGAAIVRRFARAGWRCVIHCRSSRTQADALRAELIAQGAAAQVVQFDLAAGPATVGAGLDAAFQAEPGLRVLINSASVFAYDSAAEPSEAVWNEAMTVNALAPILLAAGFATRIAPEGDACVVNLLDQKLRNPNPDFFSYTVSKAALEAASQILARAYAPRLRVANVAPGLMLPSADQTEAEFAQAATMNLLQRRTELEELAEAVHFVATSAFITGQTLYADSGQSLTAQVRDVLYLVRQQEAS
jgi:NAD(P)-dependent dehydrogenase (short-subunit alcohol dehydrogenase family)